MDNHEEYTIPSRAELIKMARESCAKNASSLNYNKKNLSSIKNKEEDKYDNLGLWSQTQNRKGPFSLSENGFEIAPMSMRLFLIRAVCAFLLFTTVIVIDKLDIKSKAVNSKQIQEWVTSNQGIEDAEDFFVAIFEKFVKAEK